jgi:hypothetical protein
MGVEPETKDRKRKEREVLHPVWVLNVLSVTQRERTEKNRNTGTPIGVRQHSCL